MKVYIVGRSRSYASWISGEFELVQNIKEANLAIFTGGEDVLSYMETLMLAHMIILLGILER